MYDTWTVLIFLANALTLSGARTALYHQHALVSYADDATRDSVHPTGFVPGRAGPKPAAKS